MSVRRDSKTGSLFFRTTVIRPDKTKIRIYGTPGVGRFADLPNNKVGVKEAERRAIHAAMVGVSLAVVTKTTPKEASKTIAEHAVTFEASYLPEGKPSEKRTKHWTLKGSLLPVFGAKLIEELKQTDIDQYAGQQLKRGMAIKTVNNRLAILSTLIKYATGRKSELSFKLHGMDAEIEAVSMTDVELLLTACKTDRERLIILLGVEAGLRAGEMRGLQHGDVKDGQITIRRGVDNQTNEIITPKHNKGRTIPVSARIAAVIERMPKIGIWIVSRLDGELLGYDGMHDLVEDLYRRAHVPRPKKIIHCLRHSFGTEMAKLVPLGVLQKLMGHADVKTTMRYVDVSEDDKRNAIAAVFGAGIGSGSKKRSQVVRK